MELKLFALFSVLVICCQAKVEDQDTPINDQDTSVIAVNVQGGSGSYQFSVTVASPDLGCEQYADWWEVVSDSGELLYRRILAHSHVDEQPFTRSGGPVEISGDQEVWVRVHMNNTGYSSQAIYGSPAGGFELREFPDGFAIGLDKLAPMPDGCRF